MIRLFLKYVLGGASNKREGTAAACLFFAGLTTYVVVKTAQGADMSPVIGLVSAGMLTSLAAFTGAASYHHHTTASAGPMGARRETRVETYEGAE
jgi:hypothetical protein